MHSCYVPPTQISQDLLYIGEPERHHLLNVLRLKRGDAVQIFDGGGNSYIAVLCDTRSPFISASIRHHQFHPPIPPHITLFQGVPKFDKMDLIVQKSTEIGVDQIVPMICHRSIPRRTESDQKKRQERWQRIANEASKQCKRPRFPTVLDARQMGECLEMGTNFGLSILLWEGETQQGIKGILRNCCEVESIGLFIGPEGGFSEEEIRKAVQSGCTPATLGNHILRTETAAIVSIALVVYELRQT